MRELEQVVEGEYRATIGYQDMGGTEAGNLRVPEIEAIDPDRALYSCVMELHAINQERKNVTSS